MDLKHLKMMKFYKIFCLFLILFAVIQSFCLADLIVDLKTDNLPYGTLPTWSNDGLLGGVFTSEGDPEVADVGGRKAVTFDGNDNFVSTVTVPDEITGNNSYTIAVWAYNPSIGVEECMVNWAKRESVSRAAQLNYGTSPSYGAVTHWDSDDMGFDSGVPIQGQWHHIAVTYEGGPGSPERVYVDGVQNAVEWKTLDLWPDGVFYLGCAIQDNETTHNLYFSGSIASVQIYDTALTEAQIQGLVTPITLNQSDGNTVVSESGQTDTYQIALGTQPSDDVTVTILNDGKVQTDVPSVTFTELNWETPQIVTVSAVDNPVFEGSSTSVLTHNLTSNDPTFNGVALELQVQVLDNDRLGDFSNDGNILIDDIALLALEWMNDCALGDFCNGTDLSGLIGLTEEPGRTDFYDFSIFSTLWQQGPILITEFMASNGDNFVTTINGLEDDPDWIELYNASPGDIDLSGWYLTDDLNNLTKWPFPSVVLESGKYIVVFASGQTTIPFIDDLGYLHTNFILDADGEDLAIVRPDGQTVSHFWKAFPEQFTDYSYGLELQTLQQGYFQTPTPEGTNETSFTGFVADTQFNLDRGFYTDPFDVEITCETPGAVIRYTTDGSMPTESNGTEYTEPVTISQTTCLRARAFKTGLVSTNTDTQTYLFLDDFWTQSRPAGYPSATYDSSHPLDYDIDQDVIGPSNLFGDVYRDTYISDLQAIPSMSIVMDVDDLFGSSEGIYANSNQDGELWERAASVEMIDPTEGDLFQVDTAIRIQGGYSRNAFESPKHNFRFIFSRPYGPPKLKYKLFPDSEVDEFDQLIVRTPCHDSWLTAQSYFRNMGLYASDGWHREMQRQMGHVSAHGRWVHLYLNGLYWGIHEVVERPNAAFAASYYGGQKEQYDCIATTLRDGTNDAWNTMFAIAAGNGTYGSITNPQAYAEIQEYLDVTNFADYFIINFYSAISDWPGFNWYACRKREPGAQFRIFCWDAEASFMSDRLDFNRYYEGHHAFDSGLGILFNDLTENEDFRLLFADRLHKHLHNDGVLNPTNAAAVYQTQLDRVEAALGPESARWGDAWSSTPQTRAEWESDQQWLFNTFFPQRGEFVINDIFRDRGIYPQTDPPEFSQYTGYASTGASFSMTNPNNGGTIYYTMDGSDPRAGAATEPPTEVFNVSDDAIKKVFVPTEDIGTDWRGGNEPYDESGWISGTSGVGYERSSGYDSMIGIDVESILYGNNTTCYIRIPFTIDGEELLNCNDLDLRIRYDDGFVAYINGTEVKRVNFTGTPQWDSDSDVGHEASTSWDSYDISDYINTLMAGENILAIHGLNYTTNSSDFLISAELVATEGGSAPGISPGAVEYTSPIQLTQSTTFKSRVYSDSGEWSAATETTIAVGPVLENLRITEIMYNPADPNHEYVELKNIGTEPINLNLVHFTEGVHHEFNDVTVSAGGYALLVRNQSAFEAYYSNLPVGVPIIQWQDGALDNDQDKMQINDAIGQAIQVFTYKDGWYPLTDGQGFSLTIRDPLQDPLLWDQKEGWRASLYAGGTPGAAAETVLVPESIVISEVLSHSHGIAPDWIELHNTTGQDINIGGWFLSDNNSDDPNLMKYQIPANTVIKANGSANNEDYVVFVENTSFGSVSANDPFGLSEAGDTVYLTSGENGQITGYYQTEENFDASESGVTFGRYEKAELSGGYDFTRMISPTQGNANTGPLIPDVIITEIHYNPVAGTDYEYVELYNRTGSPVTLMSLADRYTSPTTYVTENIPWRLEGTGFEFPANTTIPAGGRIIVAKDPTRYGGPSSSVLGPYDGKLDNGGEQIELQTPGDWEYGESSRYWIPIEKIDYDDAAPWPITPDGGGDSLHRINPSLYGRDYSNWQADNPNPGL